MKNTRQSFFTAENPAVTRQRRLALSSRQLATLLGMKIRVKAAPKRAATKHLSDDVNEVLSALALNGFRNHLGKFADVRETYDDLYLDSTRTKFVVPLLNPVASNFIAYWAEDFEDTERTLVYFDKNSINTPGFAIFGGNRNSNTIILTVGLRNGLAILAQTSNAGVITFPSSQHALRLAPLLAPILKEAGANVVLAFPKFLEDKQEEFAEKLRSKGLNVEVLDYDGENPYHCYEMHKHEITPVPVQEPEPEPESRTSQRRAQQLDAEPLDLLEPEPQHDYEVYEREYDILELLDSTLH